MQDEMAPVLKEHIKHIGILLSKIILYFVVYCLLWEDCLEATPPKGVPSPHRMIRHITMCMSEIVDLTRLQSIVLIECVKT